MNQVIDFSTLTWVKKELDQTLREARQALEAHVESPGDGAQLELLVGHLHQVYGTLQMVELYGASLLAEEMEYAARAIADKSVGHYDDACEVLMRAILQLPDYLERLIAGHRDIPLVLLPILNDLRAVRGENLLSENSMFSPDLDAPLPISLCGDAGDGNELQSQARHVRPSFQRGLLAWFRGYQPETSLGALSAVCESLQKCSRTTEAMRLWWVAAGVMDALRAGAIDSSAAVKRLIGQIDRQIKRVVDEGESALVQEPPVDLLKNLLFYVAQSRDSGPRVAEIQATYRLLDLLPGEQELAAARESLAGQNADLFATVAVAVKEELGRLKDALDLVLRGGSESAEKLQPLVDSLRSLGDTLGMLSLDAPRKAVISKAEDLSGCLDAGSPPPETALMDVASTLLFVESSVDNMGGSPAAGGAEEQPEEHLAKSEYNQVMDVVLQEAIADLVRAKDAIVAYTESSHDAAVLSDVPQWFSQVKGGLLLLGETRAAGLTGSVAKYVENELIKRADHPAQQELDSLADCICGLEYYLESRMEHRMYGGSAIGVAEVSIERLGYPANGRDQAELAVASEQADSGSGEQVAGHEQLSSGEMLEAASPDEETECSDAETVECGTFEADELTQPGEPALDALTISTDAPNLLNATPDAEEQPIAAGRECDGGFYAVQQQSTSDYEMHGRDALGDAEAESQGQHPSVDGPEAESQDAAGCVRARRRRARGCGRGH